EHAAGAGRQESAQGRSGAPGPLLRAPALRLDAGRSGPESQPSMYGGPRRDRRSVSGDHARSAGAAPMQADHSDPARWRLRQESHQAGSEPLAKAPGHHARRARKDARHAYLRNGSERLSRAIRNLRGRQDAEPQFGAWQEHDQARRQAGQPRGRSGSERQKAIWDLLINTVERTTWQPYWIKSEAR